MRAHPAGKLGEGATAVSGAELCERQFQSTPPARGRLEKILLRLKKTAISIHAPREGGRPPQALPIVVPLDFNPRPREGGRRSATLTMPLKKHFNPRPREGGRRLGNAIVCVERKFQSTPPRGGATIGGVDSGLIDIISIHAPARGGDSKDAQFYLRIFDKQVELLRFLGKIRGGCLRNPEKDRRFLGKSLANLPEISGHLDFAGGGKARPGYPCAVPLPRRAACVRGSGDPPADRCSSYRNAPLFSHIASPDSKSADCLSQNP